MRTFPRERRQDGPANVRPHRQAHPHARPAGSPPCCSEPEPCWRWYEIAAPPPYLSCRRHRRYAEVRHPNRRSSSASCWPQSPGALRRPQASGKSQGLPSRVAGSSSSSRDSLDGQRATSPRPSHRCSRETDLSVSIERFAAIRYGTPAPADSCLIAHQNRAR